MADDRSKTRRSLQAVGRRGWACAPLACSAQPRPTSAASLRPGFTLMEILIAITIMLMITAAAIPVVLPAVQGRRAREGARLISVALDTARSKAMESGRPVGVVFERAESNPHFCQTISYAEVPEPYGGDTQGSSFVLMDVYPDVSLAPLIDPVTNERFRINRIVPWNPADTGWLVLPSAQPQFFLIRPGDEIRIGGMAQKYRLEWVPLGTGTTETVGDAASGFWSIGRMLDLNPPSAPDNVPDTWRMDSASIPEPTAVDLAPPFSPAANWIDFYANTTPLERPLVAFRPADLVVLTQPGAAPAQVANLDRQTYRISRGPTRSSIPAVQMPEEMVVDLMSSGVTELGTWEQGNALLIEDAPAPPGSPGERSDDDFFYPLRTAEGTATNDGTAFPSASFGVNVATLPLIIMFGPDGALTRFYHWERDDAGIWQQISEDHQATLYLLVARREQMPPTAGLASPSWPTLLARDSWRDVENLWVMVNSSTGKIDIRPVSGITQGGFDPNVQDDFSMNSTNPRTLERHYMGVWLSRAGCREAATLGGQ